jgi:hypothetical protein
MAMSRITNTNPPARGKKLTSADLNTSFTEINNGFPMDAENVRNEGLDQPSFALAGTSGQSGIILIKADEDDNSTPVVVISNDQLGGSSPLTPPTTVQTWTPGVVPFNEDKIIRVYWQFENIVAGINTDPITVDSNGTVWAVWLEWQLSSGGSFEPVPFQSDFGDYLTNTPSPRSRGSSSLTTYASTLVNHVYIRQHSGGGSTDYDFPPARTGYGCWWFKADQNYVIYGLRLRARGLLQNYYNDYNATGLPSRDQNAWRLARAPTPSDHTMTINKSYMAYMIMEEQ